MIYSIYKIEMLFGDITIFGTEIWKTYLLGVLIKGTGNKILDNIHKTNNKGAYIFKKSFTMGQWHNTKGSSLTIIVYGEYDGGWVYKLSGFNNKKNKI